MGGGHPGNNHRFIHFMDKNPEQWPENDYEIAIWVNQYKAMEDKMRFFRSTTGAVITHGLDMKIDMKYIWDMKVLRYTSSSGEDHIARG